MTDINYEVRLPLVTKVDQYTEHFILVQDEEERELPVHDYQTIYQIPGLYQRLVVELLQCVSHEVMPDFLTEAVTQAGGNMSELKVLDFGAGIGLVGAALAKRGVRSIVGLDIVPEAKVAAERDHPRVYKSYFVEDVCQLSQNTRSNLVRFEPNSLVCVSAMGLGRHVSPQVFACAYNMMPEGSWIAFNLNAEFLEANSPTGHLQLLDHLVEQQLMALSIRQSYQHRILTDGTPVKYMAIIGTKQGNLLA